MPVTGQSLLQDKEIWEEKEKGDAIYIHRIATNPALRGNRYIDKIVEWAKEYAIQNGKRFVRLDTLGNNAKLIEHYTSAGFKFLGIFELTDTSACQVTIRMSRIAVFLRSILPRQNRNTGF